MSVKVVRRHVGDILWCVVLLAIVASPAVLEQIEEHVRAARSATSPGYTTRLVGSETAGIVYAVISLPWFGVVVLLAQIVAACYLLRGLSCVVVALRSYLGRLGRERS